MKKKLIPAKTNVRIASRFRDNARIVSVLSSMASVWMIPASWIYVPKEAVVFQRLILAKVIHVSVRNIPALIAIAVLKRRRYVPIIGGADQSAVHANVTCHRASTSHAPWTPESAVARPTTTSKVGDASLVTVTTMVRYRRNATRRLELANVGLVLVDKSVTNAAMALPS